MRLSGEPEVRETIHSIDEQANASEDNTATTFSSKKSGTLNGFSKNKYSEVGSGLTE